MNSIASARLIKHGAVIMILGLFAGFGLTYSMLGGISVPPTNLFFEMDIPGSLSGWRMAHSGNLMNGIMAIVLGLALRHLSFSGNGAAIVSWGTLIAIYGNACFYLFGLFAPNHGLSMGDNRLGEGNLAGVLAFLPALVGAVTLLVALFFVLRAKVDD